MTFSNDSKLLDSGHFVYTIHSVIPLAKKKSFEEAITFSSAHHQEANEILSKLHTPHPEESA